jgi:hypothetical protein
VPTLDRTRVPQQPVPTLSGTQSRGARSPSQPTAAVDHWTYVLLYSMGVGSLAVAALLFTVLVLVWFYGQFVWSFTHWDLASVRLSPFKSLAYLLIVGTFVGGTCAGLWIFSGAIWKNQRANATPKRRPSG